MGVDQLADGDVDNRLVDDEQLCEFVYTKSVLRLRDVADAQQELPVSDPTVRTLTSLVGMRAQQGDDCQPDNDIVYQPDPS